MSPLPSKSKNKPIKKTREGDNPTSFGFLAIISQRYLHHYFANEFIYEQPSRPKNYHIILIPQHGL
jgi:hypothetical protein